MIVDRFQAFILKQILQILFYPKAIDIKNTFIKINITSPVKIFRTFFHLPPISLNLIKKEG